MSSPFGFPEDAWIADWLLGTPNLDDESVEWLRTRPACLHALLTRFPPSCVVRAKVPLGIPRPGTCGIVTSYFEPSEAEPLGLVSVRQEPDSHMRGQCNPDDLEVVAYWQGWTPDVVRRVLEGAAA